MSRSRLLVGLLLPTLAASAWFAFQAPDSAEIVASVPQRVAPTAAPASDTRAMPRRQSWPSLDDAALAAWSGPTLPEVSAETTSASPPPPPRPPAFPYQWIGRLDDGSTPQALLSGSHRSFGVRAGDLLDGRWRVEQIASQGLQLTWVPTGDRVDVVAR